MNQQPHHGAGQAQPIENIRGNDRQQLQRDDNFRVNNNNNNNNGGVGFAVELLQDQLLMNRNNHFNNNNNNNNNHRRHHHQHPLDNLLFHNPNNQEQHQQHINVVGSIGETFLQSHTLQAQLQERTAMLLSDDERRTAIEIRQALQASSSTVTATISDKLSPSSLSYLLSDMQVAQYAVCHQGRPAPVMAALQQLHGMRAFWEHYGIDHTVEQGVSSIRDLLQQQPGYILDIDCNPQTQESVLVVDMQAFHPALALQAPPKSTAGQVNANWQTLVRGQYYLYRACQPSLASIRNGLLWIVDCEGMGWKNVQEEFDERYHAELLAHYPLKWKKIQAYNTALVANVWWGLCKRLWKPHGGRGRDNHNNISLPLELACRLVDSDASRHPRRRLAEMYVTPNLQQVETKVMRRVEELLTLRQFNEQEFQIPSFPSPHALVPHQPHQQHQQQQRV